MERRIVVYLGIGLLSFMSILGPAASAHGDEIVWGVTSSQFLVSWNSSTPNDFTFGTAISGLQANEQILGIDFRPADNQIFAVGSSNRLYTIDMNGTATQVGPVFDVPLDGSAFAYDFNPTIDRSRIDTNSNNNYVVNPNDGLITQVNDVFYPDGDENFGVDPNVVHLGYTNSFDGATTTQLFGIDSGLDILVTQANSAGTLGSVGELGVDITEVGGFDISGISDIAFGAFQGANSSVSQFYTIDLDTGAATYVGEIGGGTLITALTIQAVPEPAAFGILVPAICLVLGRRRKRAS